MARQPKPWYWKARKAWYIQINGKQVRLHEDKAKAKQEWYRLMASEGRLEQPQRDRMTVADACEALISQSQHLRASTLELYRCRLGLLAASRFGTKNLADVHPDEVLQWISGIQWKTSGTGEPSRHLTLRFVMTLYKWARDTGVIQINQFARVRNPWKIPPRTTPMSEDDYAKIMARRRTSPEFKEVVEFVWRSGIRPGELSILAARHMDARLPVARFQPAEHKTGTKTGLQREVYFPADLWERLKRYAELRPSGPLLRRPNGKPWTPKKISERFGVLKKALKIDCVLYSARHRFLTDLTDSGVPLGRVAKIAGHTHVDTLMKTYYHPDATTMAEDVQSRNIEEIQKKIAKEKQDQEDVRRKGRTAAHYRWLEKKRAKNEPSSDA